MQIISNLQVKKYNWSYKKITWINIRLKGPCSKLIQFISYFNLQQQTRLMPQGEACLKKIPSLTPYMYFQLSSSKSLIKMDPTV